LIKERIAGREAEGLLKTAEVRGFHDDVGPAS